VGEVVDLAAARQQRRARRLGIVIAAGLALFVSWLVLTRGGAT